MMKLTYMRRQAGFTIVEVSVVIAVIGILAALIIFSIGAWRSGLARDQVVSDLNSAKSAMINERNFNNVYPTSLPNSFTASKGVTVTYASGDSTSFCINGVSSDVPTVQYRVSMNGSVATEPTAGTC